MLFSDALAFYDTGRALWAGEYIGLYPFPLTVMVAGVSVFPFEVLVGIILMSSLITLVVCFKRRALLWILFMPVLQTLAIGNLDVIAMGLLMFGNPFTLAFLTLKPQLFIFAIPLLLKNKLWWKPFSIMVGIIWGIPTLFRPLWIFEWLPRILGEERLADNSSSAILPIGFLVSLVIIALLLVIHSDKLRGASMGIFPALRPYDFTLLAGGSLWLIPLSWLAFVAMIQFSAAWPMGWVGVADTGIKLLTKDKKVTNVP